MRRLYFFKGINLMMQTISTTCPYCGTGCGLLATPQNDGSVKIKGDAQHPANFGRLCSKGAALGETLSLDDRLLYPEIDGQRVGWDTALEQVADGFKRRIEQYGIDSVAFYVSGQLLTEDYYVANKLMKGFIGSANIDTNSRLCMASSVAGHKRAFGTDTVPGCYEDLEQADLVVLTGSNLAWCHPVLYQRIAAAKQQRSNMKVVVIDPRRTATCDIADLHLALRPGSDVWLFNGLLDFLRRNDHLDYEFIDAHTEGFGATLRTVRESTGSIPAVAQACDLTETDLSDFYRWFASTEKTVTVYSQGVNQSSAGTDKVNSIINCHLATGRIGKVGCGPFSVTGQPNAMGGREVGALANQLAAHIEFEHAQVVQDFWQSPYIARQPGLKAVDLFQAMADGKIKAVWIMATNPASSLPDLHTVKRALQTCEFVVVSDNVSHTDTLEFAHVKLPALAWGEKSGTVTNSERRISRQRPFLAPPGEAKADWWIVSEVAKYMGFAESFNYSSEADIFTEYAQLSGYQNTGNRDFDISRLQHISNAEYEALPPTQWPLRAVDNQVSQNVASSDATQKSAGHSQQRFFAQGGFFTHNQKARFIATQPRRPQHLANKDYDFILNSGRLRDQWHTMTRTGKTPRLFAHISEPLLSLHPDDAARLAVQDGQLAQVRSERGELILRVSLEDSLRLGEAFAPIHWNQQFTSTGSVGQVIHPSADPISGQPEFKHTPVRIKAYQANWQAFIMSREPVSVEQQQDIIFYNKVREANFMRYELAGEQTPENWKTWLQGCLGEGDWLDYQDAGSQQYRGALLRDGRLVACAFITGQGSLPQRQGLSPLFAQTRLNSSERLSVLTGNPISRAADVGATVCACFNVGRNTLVKAIREQQLTSVEAIGAALKAGTNCGSCIPELRALL